MNLKNLFFALLVTMPTLVKAQSSVTSETEVGPKKWRVTLDAQFVPLLDQEKSMHGQTTYTDYLAIGDYFLSKKHRLRVRQDFTHFSRKYESAYEFQAANTQIYHYYNFEQKPLGTSIILRTNLALPISDLSYQDGLVTAATASVFVSKLFFNNRLYTRVVPFGRYHWYKYKTSPGGRRLPLYTLGASALASWSFTDKISLMGSAFYNIVGSHSSQYDPNPHQKEEGIYSFSGALNYQATNVLGIYASYMTGAAQYINEGRYEVYLYDPRSARYGIGMTAIF